MLSTILRHAALPAIAPAAIVGLYFTPVLLFGCVNRGLLALAVVLLSATAAFVTIGIGFRCAGPVVGSLAVLGHLPPPAARPDPGPARLSRRPSHAAPTPPVSSSGNPSQKSCRSRAWLRNLSNTMLSP